MKPAFAILIKSAFLAMMLLCSTIASAQKLDSIRTDYYAAINNSKETDKLYQKLKENPASDPLILAYLGSVQALKARFSWNPYNKLNYLSEGLNTLKTAVAKSPDNLEIRFLRFSLVYYLPGFLGYGETLEPDKKKIIDLVQERKFGRIDKNLLKNMVDFMRKSNRCTPEELSLLEKALTDG